MPDSSLTFIPLVVVVVGTINEQIDRGRRSNNAEPRQENVPEEIPATVDHDLVTRMDPETTCSALWLEQIHIQLALGAIRLPSQNPHLIASAEWSRTTGLSHCLSHGGFGTHREHLGTAHFTRNSYPHKRFHDKLRVLFKPGEEGAQVRFGAAEWDSTNLHRSI